TVALSLSTRLYADNRLYSSTNLTTWAAENLGIETTSPITNNFYRPKDAPRRFYSLAQVQYASTTLAPKTVYGRTNTLNFNGGGTIVLSFNSSWGGTYTYTGSSPGTITSYVWLQEPYRGRLWPIEYRRL